MNHKLLLSIAIALAATCFTACDDDSGNDSTPKECTWNGDKCDNGNVVTCTDGNITNTVKCDNGCTDNKCNAQPTDGKKDIGAACTTNDECKSGNCTDSKCADSASTDKKDIGAACTANDECKSGNCTDNKCAEKSDPKPSTGKPGDPCDETFVESCSDNAAVYCDEGIVVSESCDTATCLKVTDRNYVSCYTDNDICTKEGETSGLCEESLFGTYAYSFKCEKTSDGKLHNVATDRTYCGLGCNDKNTACIAETDDNKTCNVAATAACKENNADCAIIDGSMECYTATDKCAKEGEQTKGCYESSYAVTYTCTLADDGKTKINVITDADQCVLSCDEKTKACAAYTDDNKTCNIAATAACKDRNYDACALVDGSIKCYSNDDKCTKEGDKSHGCVSSLFGGEISQTLVCTKADDGKTLIKVGSDDYTECGDNQVCSDETGLCVDDPIVEGGCKKSEADYCTENGLAGCALFGGEPNCYHKTCTEADLDKKFGTCNDDDKDDVYEITGTCTKSDQGAYVYAYDDATCSNGCKADGDNSFCATLVDDEGQTCDPDKFTERCDGDIMVYCGERKEGSGKYTVIAETCQSYTEYYGESHACYVETNGAYAMCLTDKEAADTCKTPGEVTKSCSEIEGHDAYTEYTCMTMTKSGETKTQNINLFMVGYYCTNADKSDYTSCNDAGTACK